MTTDVLIEKELEHVLAALTPANRLVVEVALHNGLRISDVLELRPEDLKPQTWITERKTGKRKQIGLPEPLLSRLKECCGEYWVFPGRLDEHKHRSRQAVWQDVKRAARLFRMPQNVGTHTMRKMYAVRLMKKYGDLERVRRALNHSNPSLTMIYAMADKLTDARLQRQIPRRSIRAARRG